MAIRQTTHILKNSDIVNRPLPSTLLKGEPIVNTADGIVYFSGVTTSTNNWTQAGTGSTANFFEVGSNLYDLQIRNRITKYEGVSGAGLVGKFLSGTTNGFVLADISSISSVNTYVTAFTYSNNVATIKQTQGQADLTILINTMTGLTVNGILSAITGNFNSVTTSNLTATTATIPTLVSTTLTANSISAATITGTTIYGNGANITGLPYVTGGTANNTAHTYTFTNSTGGTFTVYGLTDIVVTGGTYSAGNAVFTNNTGGTFTVTGFTTTDTFVTGFTYTPSQNKITIKQNQGQADLNVFITSVSGLTVSNLTANRLVYTSTGGTLVTGTAIFDGTDMTLPPTGSLIVGTGGLTVGSGGSPSTPGTGDLIVNGNLTVFGGTVSAFTSNLFVEDNNITLNYSPTGSTIATSIGAGWTVQDGNGIVSGNVNLNINRMDTFTGLTANNVPSVTEYIAATGYKNRGWVTQLNDIVLRSTNTSTPNGVRVLTEFDFLDGGTY